MQLDNKLLSAMMTLNNWLFPKLLRSTLFCEPVIFLRSEISFLLDQSQRNELFENYLSDEQINSLRSHTENISLLEDWLKEIVDINDEIKYAQLPSSADSMMQELSVNDIDTEMTDSSDSLQPKTKKQKTFHKLQK